MARRKSTAYKARAYVDFREHARRPRPYVGAYYDVALVEPFKGNPPARFRIFSENTTARTPLVMNKPLLLFLTRQISADEYHRVGDLTVDDCGNSARADKKPDLVRTARKLAVQKR